jgi:hypothetical protein
MCIRLLLIIFSIPTPHMGQVKVYPYSLKAMSEVIPVMIAMVICCRQILDSVTLFLTSPFQIVRTFLY